MIELFRNPNYDFIGKRKWAYYASIAFTLISLTSLMAKGGLRYDIDFTGGTLTQVRFEQAPSVAQIRSSLATIHLGESIIQRFGDEREFIIRLPLAAVSSEEVQQRVRAALTAGGLGGFEIRRVEFVGPQVGRDLQLQAAYLVLIGLVWIAIYIALRFDLKGGVAAVIAVIHDVIVCLGALSLTNREFSLPVLAALLTIIGYSVNDTIVAYDRLRENRGKMVPKGRTFAEQMNDAVNQTLSRTILTSLTTFFSAAVLLFFGGKTLEDFAFVLFVGVITGTYSTTYVAAAIVVDWTRSVEARVRRRDRRARGRRDEDRQARVLLARGAPGRELPQDARRHGARPARADDQARRPPAQHADPQLPAFRQGEEDRAGDARHLRAPGAPTRYGQGEGGARGPGAAQPQAGGLRRPPEAREQASPRARGGHEPGDRDHRAEAVGGRDRVADPRPAKALLLDLEEDARSGPGVRRDLRPHRGPCHHAVRPRLLRRPRRPPLAVAAGARPPQGLHREAEGEHVPVAPHDGHRSQGRPGRDPDPHARDAPDRRGGHRGALALQGEEVGQGQARRVAPLATAAYRDPAGHEGPARVHGHRARRPVPRRGVRLHAQGRREGAPRGFHADRLRLRGPHEGRRALRRREGERQARAAALHAPPGGHRRDHHGAEPASEPRLAQDRQVHARQVEDQPVAQGRGARALDRAGPRALRA